MTHILYRLAKTNNTRNLIVMKRSRKRRHKIPYFGNPGAALVLPEADPLRLFHPFPSLTQMEDFLFSDDDEHVPPEVNCEEDMEEQLAQVGPQRRRRAVATYEYDGDVILNAMDQGPDRKKHWGLLLPHEQDRRWMTEFRMPKRVFEELFEKVAPLMPPEEQASNSTMRSYSTTVKLLVTIHFLAHAPTLRAMAHKFQIPHASLSVCILHPTVHVLRHAFMDHVLTKNIIWPATREAWEAIAAKFLARWGLPCVGGAIDGCHIMMKKPKKDEAGGDTDAYYSYKGGVASLLLAVCDADLVFTYVDAGNPATVGDAGLWGRSPLYQDICNGLLQQFQWRLATSEEERDVSPYLVGDAAFALHESLMKCWHPTPPEGTAQARFNRKVINCRRLIEQAFGRLKGRWAYCARNIFYGNPAFNTNAIVACCGLHNFLQTRHVEYEGENRPGLDPVRDEVAGAVNGAELREFLTEWVSEN